MTGQARALLEQIIRKRSGGDPTLMITTRMKLVLKGFDPDRFSVTTPDDPVVIGRIKSVAAEMGVNL